MATGQTGASPIEYQSPLGGDLLTNILGRRTNQTQNSNQLSQQLLQQLTTANQQGSQTGTSSGTTTTSANIDPLMGVYQAGMAGMDPATLSALIQSVFQEGAQGVPSLIGAYANSTGSRASRNSGLQLALGDLNRQLSSSVVQAMLQANQQGQQNAGNAAAQIAANTRATSNTGATQQANTQNTQGTTNQTQTGVTQNQQQTRTTQGVNPSMAGLLGLGGTALNFLGKTPWGKALTGTGGAGGTSPGTIGGSPPMGGVTGAVGAPAPSYGALSAPAPSSGLLASPTPAGFAMPGTAPMVGSAGGASSVFGGSQPFAIPGITDAVGGLAPVWGGGTGIGAFDPLSGATDYFGTGNFWGGNNADVFGTAGTGSLGSNLPTADWGIDYGGMTGGILGQGGTDYAGQFAADEAASSAAISGAGGGVGDFFGGIGGFLGDAWDTVSGWFANGGFVNPHVLPPAPQLAAKINRYQPGGYADGGLVGTVDQSLTGGNSDPASYVPGGVARSTFNDLSLGMIVPGVIPGFANGGLVRRGDGMSYADGGQISTGGNVRNRNNMGLPPRRQQTSAINYEGYAAPAAAISSPAGVGASQPTSTTVANVGAMNAGASGQAHASPNAFGVVGQQQQAVYVDPAVQMMEALRAQQEQAARITLAQQGASGLSLAGGSGGVGEGAAPTGNEADAGAAGIGPSGIAGAPTGTSAAVNAGLGLAGMPTGIPGMPVNPLTIIALIASMVNQANQPTSGVSGSGTEGTVGAVSSPVGQNNVTGIDIGTIGLAGLGDSSSGTASAASADNAGAGTSGDTGEGDGAGPGGGGGAGSGAGGDYANGGMVRGPGTGTSDSIKVKSREPGGKQINYSDGEFVIPKDVVDHFGAATFQSIIDAFHTPA